MPDQVGIYQVIFTVLKMQYFGVVPAELQFPNEQYSNGVSLAVQ